MVNAMYANMNWFNLACQHKVVLSCN